MQWLIVKNDLERNKVINLALLLFMMLSAGLAVLSVIVAVQTFTSISDLYKTAQPPHFVQMHKGEIDETAIDTFMSGNNTVTHWQIHTMINVYGESLTVVGEEDRYDLGDSRLDIGLVKQNESKDLLLNSDHERVSLQKGEMGIPVILRGVYGMEIGDRVILTSNSVTKEFVIQEFILDSMMNSTMASSTRILISDEDYRELSGQVGENEYLIEAYFADSNLASDFQTSYENAGLPQNGQAITYTIIFILSALTDIVTIFVLLLVSILLIMVSFICVRFTIMAALEEEVGEIGTMKAIGLSFTDIRNLYLYKYRVLAVTGVVSGTILALVLSDAFTKHISATFGNTGMSALTWLLSIVVGCHVYLLTLFYCKKLLKKIKKVTVVDALVRGKGFDKGRNSIKDGLHKSKKLSVNLLMGVREVFYQFKNWLIIFAVVLIAVLMILIPIKLLSTFEAPEFITYMGSSLEDILVEVENGEKLETNYESVKLLLENDESIKNYYEFRRVRVLTAGVAGEPMNLHIDSGDGSGSGLQYLSGGAPQTAQQLAVSLLNAEKLGKETGDTLSLSFGDGEHEFLISGIYQDVTSGGYTAKSVYDFSVLPAERYTFSVNLNEDNAVLEKAAQWEEHLGTGVTVDPIEDFIDQTLGGVSNQLRTIVFFIVIIGASLAMLITVLFLKLRMAKDFSEIAVLRALGFTKRDIQRQYMIKIGLVSTAGILAGILSTQILGESVVNAALSFSGLGIKRVELVSTPMMEYILCPLFLLALILFVTLMAVRKIKRYNILSIINE